MISVLRIAYAISASQTINHAIILKTFCPFASAHLGIGFSQIHILLVQKISNSSGIRSLLLTGTDVRAHSGKLVAKLFAKQRH